MESAKVSGAGTFDAPPRLEVGDSDTLISSPSLSLTAGEGGATLAAADFALGAGLGGGAASSLSSESSKNFMKSEPPPADLAAGLAAAFAALDLPAPNRSRLNLSSSWPVLPAGFAAGFTAGFAAGFEAAVTLALALAFWAGACLGPSKSKSSMSQLGLAVSKLKA